MRKLLFLLSVFTIILSCSNDETPPPAPIVKYTITLSAGEGGTVSTTGGEYEAGQTVSVTATPQGNTYSRIGQTVIPMPQGLLLYHLTQH